MGVIVDTLQAVWMLCIGWMPPLLAAIVTIALAIMIIFLIVKLISLILSAIPFL